MNQLLKLNLPKALALALDFKVQARAFASDFLITTEELEVVVEVGHHTIIVVKEVADISKKKAHSQIISKSIATECLTIQ